MSTPFSSLQEASERIAVEAADGATLPLYALAGPERAPGLLVGHANGLAAGSYGPWLRELARSFRVFAFDARGHGGATWPAGPFKDVFSVDRFADDLARVALAVRAKLGAVPLHYAGHSLSAAAAVRLALDGAELPFDVATLFEPPIFPPPQSPHYAEANPQQEKLVRGSLRRERRWASPAAFEAYLKSRGVFRGFEPEMLSAHCEACLRPEGDDYVLCCPPEVESAIFANHRPADTWSRLATVRARLHLVSGDPSAGDRDWVTGAMASIAQGLDAASLEVLQGAGHMMIFQQSQRCAELLRRQIAP
jgi:pimeloyl-ACP methyl ester carboxylesterase